MRTLTGFAAVVVVLYSAILVDAQDPTKGQEKTQPNPQEGKIKAGAVRKAKATGHVSNYDEAKVKPYTLPDVLKMANGEVVKDAKTWFEKRRPEILELFRKEIYGRIPENRPRVRWEVASTEPKALNGTATMKRVVGHMTDKADGPRLNLSVYIPAKAKEPVPVILTITFGGGAGGKGAKGGGAKADPIATEILAKGWAFASIGYNDIQPDRDNAFNEGVIGLTLKPGQKKPAADEWGGVSAWAWGISRIVDYFESDQSIDAMRIGIQGHSRLGRTVLWAGAQDERIAATFASCSGCTGAALARYDWGETVDDMAQNYAWQLGGNYQKWVGKWNDMPVDSHMLIACVAPRLLFCNGGTTDQWAAPKSQFLAMVAAGPVYKMLGAKDLGITQLP
ncbi:MAG TPA: hypothetical protein VE988_25865, partial [Gemmataceae bacterium]|nr:hypothetical protein [Gemmataceae bacterium]